MDGPPDLLTKPLKIAPISASSFRRTRGCMGPVPDTDFKIKTESFRSVEIELPVKLSASGNLYPAEFRWVNFCCTRIGTGKNCSCPMLLE
jgi:hypothetical protein